MNTAHVGGEKRGPARSGERGLCPGCRSEVVGKCGEVVSWHWAHVVDAECDRWWEPEGEWHRRWKAAAAEGDTGRMEVRIEDGGQWHVADALAGDGRVVELQHSPLAPSEVREREGFYTRMRGGMLWVFDYRTRSVDGRDVRLDTAGCIRLLDLGDEVVGLVAGEREVFARWPVAAVQRLIATSGVGTIQAFHDTYVSERESLRLLRIRKAKEAEEARLRAEEEARQARKEAAYQREVKILERSRAAEEARLAVQGGRWVLEHPEHPDIAGIKLRLMIYGSISAREALAILPKDHVVSPAHFPFVIATARDLDQLAQADVKRVWPYLSPATAERLSDEAARRRSLPRR